MADSPSKKAKVTQRTLFVIGFGAVGQAWLRFIKHVNGKGLLTGVEKIRYFAPEIKEKHEDGIFEFNPAPFVTRETLVPLLDSVSFIIIILNYISIMILPFTSPS